MVDALRAPGGTTNRELLVNYGIMDGRKRISELMAMGYPVIKTWEDGKNRYGEPTRYLRYSIREVEDGRETNVC